MRDRRREREGSSRADARRSPAIAREPSEPGRAPPRRLRRSRALAAAAFAAAAWVAVACSHGEGSPASPPGGGGGSGSGFAERAQEAGIDFRMSFLPNEQGENFKINLYDHGSGVAVADVNGDGYDDVYLLNQLGSNRLYLNDGKGHFTDVTEKAGVGLPDVISVAATFADVDGDGDQDLYVTTTRGGNVLFRNAGDGTFEEVTGRAGLSLVAHSEGAVFFDADGDGDLDLLVTNTAKWTTDGWDAKAKYYLGTPGLFEMLSSPKESNRFYRNRGDGTFEDATREAGLTGVGWGGDVAVFDMDGDGDLDLYVCNMFGRSQLLRNDGKGRFEDVTKAVLGRTSWGSVGAKAFDYDGDGLLDLLVVDMHSDMWMSLDDDLTKYPETRKFSGVYGPLVEEGRISKAEYDARISHFDFAVQDVVYGTTLFHNLGGGRFEEVSDKAGVETLWPWGIAVGDFDEDGFEDVFIPSGMGYPYRYWRSPLLMNLGNGTFEDRSREAGMDPPPGGPTRDEEIRGKAPARSSRSAATADFDGDGRLDLVVNNFNDRAFLWMNRFPARHWVEVRLLGTGMNRDAVGAVLRLKVGGRTLVRQVQAAGGYLAQSSKTLHFGLGDHDRIDAAEVRWPSGDVQDVSGLRIDRRNDVSQNPRRP